MAKSKIYAKLSTAVNNYNAAYEHVLSECKSGHVPDNIDAFLNTQASAVRSALQEADTHYANLEKRMGPDKTVGDRLKNLKNVFKDQAQLATARAQVKKDIQGMEKAFDAIERCLAMVVQYRQQG